MLCIYTTLDFEINLFRTDISAQKFAEESAVARANLVEKLALRTQEAAQHERNFQQMAELAPCGMLMQRFIAWLQLILLGMFTFDQEGTITWANPQCKSPWKSLSSRKLGIQINQLQGTR